MLTLVQKVNSGPMAAVPMNSSEVTKLSDTVEPVGCICAAEVGLFLGAASLAYAVGHNS